MAIHKLLCLLDGFEIAGAFDDFRWAQDVVSLVDKKTRYGDTMATPYRREHYSALSHRCLAQSCASDTVTARRRGAGNGSALP
jgi:hypothetical protein